MTRVLFFLLLVTCLSAHAANYDVLLQGGTVYDGTGSPGKTADIGIVADQIVA